MPDVTSNRAAVTRRLRSLGVTGALIWSAVRLVVRAAPWRCAVTFGIQMIASLAIIVQVVLIDRVLTALLGVGADERSAGDVILPVALLALVTAMTGAGMAIGRLQHRVLEELVERAVWRGILDVGESVDLATYEDPDFYDQASRVQAQAAPRTQVVTQAVVFLAGDTLAIAAGTVALLATAPILAPLLLLSGVPLVVTSRLAGQREYAFAVEHSARNRQRAYLQSVLVQRELAKEVRAFALQGALRARWEHNYADFLGPLHRHVGRRLRLDLAGHAGSALLTAGALVLAVVLVDRGQLDLASAGAALVAVRVLGARVNSATYDLAGILESALFLRDVRQFLSRRPASDRAGALSLLPPGEFSELTVSNVSFAYPGVQRSALNDVSLTVRRGQVVALVGENGSGKSTLAKLLADLYQPDAGKIEWDGVDLRQLEPDSVRRRIAVLFQDFARFKLSARDNVAFGALGNETDHDTMRRAARAADADGFLSALPQGYETTLSKEYVGGVDLSLGQWQRVALARAFARDAPFLILDEPSASLDPRAEHELFELLRSLFADRTVLVVSHRFSTVRNADRIYVLSEGRVIEEGDHSQLMALEGVYAELFELQASGYFEE